MRKKIAILTVIGLLMGVSGCMGKYKITYDKDDVYNCPKSAKAGETVTFETVVVCDADLYVYINGEELKPVREGYYEFVMPEEDVTITVSIVANGLA